MARRDPDQTVTQSVLDRLIDREPQNASEGPLTRAQSVRQLKASLRRDLEWLLNTRRTPEPAPGEYQEAAKSIYNYGLTDLSSMSRDSDRDRVRVVRMIEEALVAFEPRIARVKVTPLEAASGAKHVLRFQIEGLLQMDPAPEVISFDTSLQLASGEYQVKGESSAG